MNTEKKVIVAMSGGVDSSVAAALLQEQGFEVEGIFMKNWSPETIQGLTDCPWEQDQADAAAVCEHLGIPFRSINFEREYKDLVVDYFVSEYRNGRTPNPDVMCNKEIKFKAFLKMAEESGADFIATGHYARVENNIDGSHLFRGFDDKKDQSYFLYTLPETSLRRTIFPLAQLKKEEVRVEATRFKLPTATKKDSQGICFIGHIDLKKFLSEHISAKPGETYLLPPFDNGTSFNERKENARPVGKHQGVMFYTIGERAGAYVDNSLFARLRQQKIVPSTYIIEKDLEKNILYVCDDHNDDDLFVRSLEVNDWKNTGGSNNPTLLNAGLGFVAQIRYQQSVVNTILEIDVRDGGSIVLKTNLNTPFYAPALGQSLVLYNGDEVIGGGVINKIIRS